MSEDFEALVRQEARIPTSIAKRLELSDASLVEVAGDDSAICSRKAPSRSLADLIARIAPENVHEPMFDSLNDRERW